MTRQLLILGSTGSIGESTLSIVDEHKESFKVKALVANRNVQRLAEQACIYGASYVAVADESKYEALKLLLATRPEIKIFAGKNGLKELLAEQYDITIAAIVGMECLEPIMQVMPNTKLLGLANKESIVCAGELLLQYANKCGTTVIPIDSEHSAVFQALESHELSNIEKVVLTASGGPFYSRTPEQMRHITVSEAVAHPTWRMGAKISIDSATLMNKGLELIEAHYLFGIAAEKLDAVIHPQSLVHAFVQYADGSTLAQIAVPDMRTPIAIALNYPNRLKLKHKNFSWDQLSKMQFIEPDETQFPCLKLAKDVLKSGQPHCIALNTANEIAVQAFMDNRLSYQQIPEVVRKALDTFKPIQISTLDDVFAVVENVKALIYKKFRI